MYKTVSKHKHREVIYPVIAVSWRDFDGEKHTKFFGEKRPSSIEQAELDAFYFAARKRAELTGGVLNVNPFWSCFIVDKGG
ncbi:hypothetical protein [Vibrio harveyi]|uniref:hypothetical protein n=1 Tax=Vibrio harveyi TaxID=669 RepID=UPI000FD75C45|nr:hypothetical protein [Vibrio harveyi]MBY7699340.1 hypothetical protein [Vibrio harveyi]UIL56475.1 hypothetical protein LXG94_02245 [Vibrio harveyi]